MSSLTKEEYLKLIESLLDQQYDDELEEDSWIPSEPDIKKKIETSHVYNGTIDLTTAKKEKIRSALNLYGAVKIDNFLIKINKRYPAANITTEAEIDATIYEDRFQTPSGNPCRMTYRVDLSKDTRFSGRSWLKHFSKSGDGKHVSLSTMVEIVRWMQAIKRMTAFL